MRSHKGLGGGGRWSLGSGGKEDQRSSQGYQTQGRCQTRQDFSTRSFAHHRCIIPLPRVKVKKKAPRATQGFFSGQSYSRTRLPL